MQIVHAEKTFKGESFHYSAKFNRQTERKYSAVIWQRDSRRRPTSPVQVNACSCTSTSYETFTNKEAGRVLTQIAENVWGAERPFKWNGIDVNGRMAVLRLRDGSLWVHSPVGLDDNLKSALEELGPVKHVVSPNFEIDMAINCQRSRTGLNVWQKAYKQATLYACPGLQEKADMKYDLEFDPSSSTLQQWGDEVEFICLTYERNPFTGSPFFNEVVFYYKPGNLMITSDLFWNYPSQGTGFGTKAWKFGMDKIYNPFYKSFMIGEKDVFKTTMQGIFNRWDFRSIVPCHGDVVQSDGKAILRAHLGLKPDAWPLRV